MLQATIIMEDTIVIAQLGYERDKDGLIVKSYWDITVCDTLSGKSKKAQWSEPEWQAVVYLMYSDGNNLDMVGGHMYRIAEPLFKDWPQEVRCIP